MANNVSLQILKLMGKAPKPMKYIDSTKRAYVINLRSTNLASVKSILASFDPWHPKSTSVRSFAFSLSVPDIRDTNINCSVRLDVKSDMTHPQLLVDFIDGHKAIFKTENLNRIEIVKLFNAICQERVPPASSKPGPQTKSSNTKPKPKKK